MFKFKVKWDKENGINIKTHTDYIENFGNTFYEQVKRLIDKNQVKEFENEKVDKFVKLDTCHKMVCQYNYKFKKWVPIRLCL